MAHPRLFWQIFPSCLLIALVSVFGTTWYAIKAAHDNYLEQTRSELLIRVLLLEERVLELLAADDAAGIQDLCLREGAKTGTRLSVILPTGLVVADSENDPREMDNHAARPEVAGALVEGEGDATRFSQTLQHEMMYVAKALGEREQPLVVLRASMALESINAAQGGVYWRMALGALVATCLSALISLFISRRISRPLEELKSGAERFAQGDLSGKLSASKSVEIAALAQAMNQMAEQLDERLRTVVRQRNEQEAVLAGMVEGVLAIDLDKRVIMLNQAAATWLETDVATAQGRSLQEVVRNADLQRFIEQTMAGNLPSNEEIGLQLENERYLQTYGAVLKNVQGDNIGVLVVLNDVTRLRRLETVRSDFVSNVTHELKTPVTSIKGFVETLLDGAMRDPDDLQRFLQIIANQAERLTSIIEDLLMLARIEEDHPERSEIPLEEGALRSVLEAALSVCEHKAAQREVCISLSCSMDLRASINAPLLEQAVINLLDNAIKYSNPGSAIQVQAVLQLAAGANDAEIVIEVCDEGCGIASEHLPRLFERFYRVDKARSRKLGGTGLGLAIVKHIAQIHQGCVVVESNIGHGSSFSIHFPLLPSQN